MNPNVIAAAVSTCGTALVAIIAIVQQARQFDILKLWLQSEFRRVNERLDAIDKRLEKIESRVADLEKGSRLVQT